ncbi:MAG: hypothetical protein OXF30_00255 [Candidatus Saccharibacteria bacterium]|nr:hypothetical protein [Candidatus Saccharibacteria bacterium]
MLINLEDLKSDKYKMLYYVRPTRARSYLMVAINRNQKSVYDQLEA